MDTKTGPSDWYHVVFGCHTPTTLSGINTEDAWWFQEASQQNQFHNELLASAINTLLAAPGGLIWEDYQLALRILLKGSYRWGLPITCHKKNGLDIPSCKLNSQIKRQWRKEITYLRTIHQTSLVAKQMFYQFVPSEENQVDALSRGASIPPTRKGLRAYTFK